MGLDLVAAQGLEAVKGKGMSSSRFLVFQTTSRSSNSRTLNHFHLLQA